MAEIELKFFFWLVAIFFIKFVYAAHWNIWWKLVELGKSPTTGPRQSMNNKTSGNDLEQRRVRIAWTLWSTWLIMHKHQENTGCTSIYYYQLNLMFKQTTVKLFKTEIEIVTRLPACSRLSSWFYEHIVSVSLHEKNNINRSHLLIIAIYNGKPNQQQKKTMNIKWWQTFSSILFCVFFKGTQIMYDIK